MVTPVRMGRAKVESFAMRFGNHMAPPSMAEGYTSPRRFNPKNIPMNTGAVIDVKPQTM